MFAAGAGDRPECLWRCLRRTSRIPCSCESRAASCRAESIATSDRPGSPRRRSGDTRSGAWKQACRLAYFHSSICHLHFASKIGMIFPRTGFLATDSRKEQTMQLDPYLTFNGQCEAAFKFYEECLGGKIEAMMTHRESPMANQVAPECRNKVLDSLMIVGRTSLSGSH